MINLLFNKKTKFSTSQGVKLEKAYQKEHDMVTFRYCEENTDNRQEEKTIIILTC